MEKKKVGRPKKLIEVENQSDIIGHELYVNEVKTQLGTLKARLEVQPPEGKRFKRTPLNEMEERGLLADHVKIIKEFGLIVMKKSNYPVAVRDVIVYVCTMAFNKVKPQFKVNNICQ